MDAKLLSKLEHSLENYIWDNQGKYSLYNDFISRIAEYLRKYSHNFNVDLFVYDLNSCDESDLSDAERNNRDFLVRFLTEDPNEITISAESTNAFVLSGTVINKFVDSGKHFLKLTQSPMRGVDYEFWIQLEGDNRDFLNEVTEHDKIRVIGELWPFNKPFGHAVLKVMKVEKLDADEESTS